MRALEFIAGHVIYNPAYTYKFQLKTTHVCSWKKCQLIFDVMLVATPVKKFVDAAEFNFDS